MDRRWTESPSYTRQWSGGSSTGSTSPAMSPAHRQSRLGQPSGYSTIKRTQNVAAKAAAQRLAHVMESHSVDDDDDEDDDLGFQFAAPTSFGNKVANNNGSGSALSGISFGKPNRSSSPALGRNFMEHTPTVHSTSAGRPSVSARTTGQAVLPSRPSLRHPGPIPPPIEPPTSNRLSQNRFTKDIGRVDKDTGSKHEASALRDELDMLQEEHDHIIDKLRHVEEKREEAEATAREFEKQVASLIFGSQIIEQERSSNTSKSGCFKSCTTE